MTEEMSPKTIKPSRSVPIRFIGRIIAETQWDTRDGCWMRFTVWETRAGAYITEISGDAPGKPDQIHCAATVVEPIMGKDGERDETAMQIAVIHAFDGHDRAKRMLKNDLGWSPHITVD